MVSHADIVRDMLARVRQAEQRAGRQLDDQLALQVEREIRQFWGGDKAWVSRRQARDDMEERNRRIQVAYVQGQRVAEIASTEQISERQVLRVIGRSAGAYR